GGEAFIPDLTADRAHPIEAADRWLVVRRMVDAPSRAVRPVHANPVAQSAAEQHVAGHAERLRLGVEERVLDSSHRQRYDAAPTRPRNRVQLSPNLLVLSNPLS